MTNTERNVEHTDKLGRVAEDLAVLELATRLENCIVSKIGNNQLHDIEIRKKGEPLTENICKIQVKSTSSRRTVGDYQNYLVSIQHGAGSGKKTGYDPEDLDFLFIYVFQAKKFYIIPTDAIKGKIGAALFVGLSQPKRKHSAIYEKYLDAWWLIGEFLGVQTPDDKRERQTLLSSLDE